MVVLLVFNHSFFLIFCKVVEIAQNILPTTGHYFLDGSEVCINIILKGGLLIARDHPHVNRRQVVQRNHQDDDIVQNKQMCGLVRRTRDVDAK